MKKSNYVKPTITFQNLALYSDVSAGCSTSATFAPYMCPVSVDDFPFTLIVEGPCEAYAPEISDTLCYHVPTADSNVFSS